MIFGANCQESSIVVQRYVKFLLGEISEIEKKTFQVNGTNVMFKCAEFRNDLKMMTFSAGEFPVSATYISTYANVNIDNYEVPKGTFGSGSGHAWHP